MIIFVNRESVCVCVCVCDKIRGEGVRKSRRERKKRRRNNKTYSTHYGIMTRKMRLTILAAEDTVRV